MVIIKESAYSIECILTVPVSSCMCTVSLHYAGKFQSRVTKSDCAVADTRFMGIMVTNVYALSNYNRLHIIKALEIFESDNKNNNNNHLLSNFLIAAKVVLVF